MIKHSILLFVRSIKKHKSTFLINIIGLSTGLASALLIVLWITHEINTDSFSENNDRVFQVMHNANNENGIETNANTPALLAEELAKTMPEVEYAVSVIPTAFNSSNGITKVGTLNFKSTAQYVTPDFFNVFPYKLIEGKKNEVLSDTDGIVISKSLATKLYGSSENCVGKPLTWEVQDINVDGFVSGVFEDIPENMTNKFDLLLNFDLFLKFRPWFDDWEFGAQHTFLITKEGALINELNFKIKDFWKSKVADAENPGTLFLQNYSDRYLYGHYENGHVVGGRIAYLRLFSIIAIFILIIACINFINLSTAKASNRIKEVGIKKVAGATSETLIFQYLAESFLLVLFALMLAIGMVFLVLPVFSTIINQELIFNLSPTLIWSIMGMALFTAIIAGSYPAFYLSKLRPVSILKGKLLRTKGEVWARKGLVVFQFAVSVLLIVAVSVIYKQINFIQNKNIGFDKDHLIYFRVDNPTDALISEIRTVPGVLNAGGIYNEIPITPDFGTIREVNWEGKSADDNTTFAPINVGYDFIETLGFNIKSGHSFLRDFGSEDQVLINEAAAKAMGFKSPIGRWISVQGVQKEIVGLVQDFNFESLHNAINPSIIQLFSSENLPKVMVKIKAGQEKSVITQLDELIKKRDFGLPLEYKFLAEDYQALYKSEQQIASLSKYFAGLAIIISCLGLFGLTAFTAEQKRKEIGIRKVLGQDTWKITLLLVNEFFKLVLIAVIIALPLSYFLTENWLANYAYRVVLPIWYFLGAGLLVILIAVLTVSFQAIKAAIANPIKSLRTE